MFDRRDFRATWFGILMRKMLVLLPTELKLKCLMDWGVNGWMDSFSLKKLSSSAIRIYSALPPLLAGYLLRYTLAFTIGGMPTLALSR